jgi:hypothetical protein
MRVIVIVGEGIAGKRGTGSKGGILGLENVDIELHALWEDERETFIRKSTKQGGDL